MGTWGEPTNRDGLYRDTGTGSPTGLWWICRVDLLLAQAVEE